jgi:hypothetical protein
VTETEPGHAPDAGNNESVLLRRNRNFRMLWIGQVLSGTGTNAARIAYPLLVLDLTHSALIAGAVGTAGLVVRLVVGLPGGALADRLDRRSTMIVCDIARMATLALLAILVILHIVTWPIVLVVSATETAASVIFDPASTAILPRIVTDAQLERAWATTEARTSAAGLVGPPLGGLLFGLSSSLPFIGDAVSYLLSVGTAYRIRGSFRPDESRKRSGLWREIAAGIQLSFHDRLLRAVLAQVPLISFAFTGVEFTVILALRHHGVAPGLIGLAQAGIAAGGLLGALAAPRLQGKLSLQSTVVTLAVTGTVMFAVGALILPSPLVAVPVALTLFYAPVANATLFGAMLRQIPDEMRGRVGNTIDLAASGLAAIAPLAAGSVVQRYSGQWAMFGFAATMAAATAVCLLVPVGRAGTDTPTSTATGISA